METSGYIYGFPGVPVACDVTYEEDRGCHDSPKKYERGILKFKVNYKDM
jgi:hypothetical protein